MRQGDSDQDIVRSRIMGRKKIAQVREAAQQQGWLAPGTPLPDDARLAAVFACKEALPSTCVSMLEQWRDQIAKWLAAGVQGATIHATLKRYHGYTGSYSSVYCFCISSSSSDRPRCRYAWILPRPKPPRSISVPVRPSLTRTPAK